MRTYHIPLVGKVFSVYCGSEEWARCKRAAIKAGAFKEVLDKTNPETCAGRAFGGWIWVRDISDRSTLIHELSHLLDDLMESLNSTDSEFRAYCTEWVIDKVLTWTEE